MRVVVIFDFPEITDPDSEDASFAIDSLSDDLDLMASTNLYQWYIDDAVEDIKNG